MDSEPIALSPLVIVTLILIGIDVAYGLFRAIWGNGTAEPFGEFLTSRVTVILLLIVASFVDLLLPNIPVLYLCCLFYCAISIAHIIEGAREEGAPIPPPLANAMRTLKDASSGGKRAPSKSK